MSIACPPLPPKRAGRQGPWLHRSYPASALLRPCPTPRRARPPCRGRRSCELHPPGPPFLHCGLPWLTCRAHYPGGPNRCQCRLLPGPCGLPRISGGSASAISLSRPAQAGLRVTACQLARPAFPGLCHEASARPITRPRRSSASMLTDNYIGGLLPPTGCPRRKGALKNPG